MSTPPRTIIRFDGRFKCTCLEVFEFISEWDEDEQICPRCGRHWAFAVSFREIEKPIEAEKTPRQKAFNNLVKRYDFTTSPLIGVFIDLDIALFNVFENNASNWVALLDIYASAQSPQEYIQRLRGLELSAVVSGIDEQQNTYVRRVKLGEDTFEEYLED